MGFVAAKVGWLQMGMMSSSSFALIRVHLSVVALAKSDSRLALPGCDSPVASSDLPFRHPIHPLGICSLSRIRFPARQAGTGSQTAMNHPEPIPSFSA